MKRKIIGVLAAIAMCFTLLSTNTVMAAEVLTNNKTGTQDGYDYELWKDNGNTSMTLNGNGKFSCQWSNINNALFRIGKKFDSTKTYQQIGNISVDYGCEYNPSGNSYLCVYGWTKSPLVEYYIVDSWGTWRPPGATSKGTITVDGGTYDVYETTRVNQPSIEGNTTFKQYWSVRTSKRTSGTITVSDHFKAWEKMGMTMGKLYEVALTVEGYQSSGSANVYKNNITIGGASSGGEQPTTNTWTNTADISWINPSSKVVALTFDDGPISNSTAASRIQDVMKKNKMHCTFFYWGNRINSGNTAEIRSAYELGCEVGNHTYTHTDLTKMSSAQIQDEISRTNNILKDITGKNAHLVRPPYLANNQTVMNAVNAPLITCSVDSRDWDGASKDQIISNVLNNVKDGSIVLMHETYDATAQAVEYLVPELIKRGYTIVSVSELAKIKGVNMTSGKAYGELIGNNITTEYKGDSGTTNTPNPPATEYVTLTDGWYYIKNTDAQKYLQVKNNTGANGQNVEIGTGTGAQGQKWYLKNLGDGYVTLKNGTGYALDVANAKDEDCANIQVYTVHNLDAQQFKLLSTEKGNTYGIVTKCSKDKKGLDVENKATLDGTNVQQYSYYGAGNQTWNLESCEATGTTKPTEPTTDPKPTEPTTESKASVKVSSDWGDGAVADITITNTTGTNLKNWTCTITTNRPITSVWNATLVAQSGNTYTIAAPSWKTDLATGESYTFGCQFGSGSNGVTLSNVTLK